MNLKYIDIHTHNNENGFAVKNLLHNETIEGNGLFSKGLHPWHIDSENYLTQLKSFEDELKLKNIIAIGECGLDKLRGHGLDIQQKVFEWHAKQAEELGKPLIIHCVGYFNEIINLKIKHQPKTEWIIHGFNSKIGILEQLLKYNFYISLGTNLLKNNLDKLKQYLEILPSDKLFFETDESKINIENIYSHSSNLLNIEIKELVKIIENNFNRVFST